MKTGIIDDENQELIKKRSCKEKTNRDANLNTNGVSIVGIAAGKGCERRRKSNFQEKKNENQIPEECHLEFVYN